MRVFLDANILFSAAWSDGSIRQLLRALSERGHECCVDAYVVEEARRNLEMEGPAALQALEALLAGVEKSSAQAMGTHATETRWLPEKDRPVLAAAIALKCDALVTGDRMHFGSGYGRSFGGVTIYSARMLAEAVI